MGEEPGRRGFALPGMQSRLSPLVATAVLAVVVTVWHVPLLFLEEGGLETSFAVSFVGGTVAVTFWYAWLFNHSRGSVLLVLIAHSVEGSIQDGGLIYMGVWMAVALVLVVSDWAHWRRPAPVGATTPVPAVPKAVPGG